MNGYEQIVKHLPAAALFDSVRGLNRPYRLLSGIARRVELATYTSISAGIELRYLLSKWAFLRHTVFFLYGDYDLYLAAMLRTSRRLLAAALHNPPNELRRRLGDAEHLRKCDGIVCLGSNVLEFLQDRRIDVKTAVVPHGVDTDFFSPCEGYRRERRVLIVGWHLRDWELTRQVLAGLRRAEPEIRVDVVGPAAVRDELPKEEWIQIHEWVDDEKLREFYWKSGLLLYLPSDCVASNAVVEAMSCGLPVVTVNRGAVKEYVSPGCGLICNRASAAQVVDAALSIIRDESLAECLGRTARARAMELDWKRVAAEITGFLEGL
ncbi:MAG: glycosyltransferase family 4 protein [Thermogemmata sp.]